MPYSITTRDGITINNIPDDVAPDAPELKARVQAIRAKGADALNPPTAAQEIGRQAGLTLRAGAEGLAGLAGIVTDPVAALANQVLPRNMQMQPLQQAVSQILTDVGVPQPQNATERVVQQAAQAMAGAGGTLGVGRMLAQGAGTVAQGVGQALAAQPLQQVAGAAGAGAAGQTAQEAGVGPVGQVAASLAGGVAGAGLAGLRTAPRPGAAAPADVAAAERAGVPLMTTDVAPPNTWPGKFFRAMGERIPVAGTGGMRADQQKARAEAARLVLREFGADDAANAGSDAVMAQLAQKRSGDLTKYATMKGEVIERLSANGAVPLPNTIAAIDEQVAKLQGLKTAEVQPVIAKLDDWKQAIQGQNLANVETLRKQIGEAFKAPELAAARGTGEKALSAIYGPLKQDMGDFIAAQGGKRDLTRWGVANARLADLAGELKSGTLRSVLNRGDVTPEAVNQLLFSAKKSDVQTLYRNLTPEGRANARAAVLARAMDKAGGIENISPDKFKNEVQKLGNQVGVFFKGDDLKRVEGLQRALQLTARAGQANVMPETGAQLSLPIGAAFLADFLGSGGAAVASGLALGGLARAYESAPVRNLLMKIPQTVVGSKEEATLVKRLVAAIQQANAAQSQPPNKEAPQF